jgi:hypothetical protein
MKIENDFYSSELVKGTWITKANQVPFTARKMSEYKDPPRFKMILTYENEIKRNYHSMLGKMTKDVVNKLKELVK